MVTTSLALFSIRSALVVLIPHCKQIIFSQYKSTKISIRINICYIKKVILNTTKHSSVLLSTKLILFTTDWLTPLQTCHHFLSHNYFLSIYLKLTNNFFLLFGFDKCCRVSIRCILTKLNFVFTNK